ncbi:hypothetical protein Psfp_02458 [Pelotomaculum sp. FP]|uniref:DUF3795 domain-containing protein n=1 Tax=Pelotomaculum sp. FP TaxID=261474 RepID=UPI001065CB3F|nr:DUF3795 domain-containing protein [Pelotomaculum sp. FP]TEB15011.1 hypothetical protein Psfp_02458 [Pelotomaculum sp. FP]
MDKLMSYCGLMCNDCDAYKATVNNDDILRKQTAENWSKIYGTRIEDEEINCLGCKSDVIFFNCVKCEVRGCNMVKNSNNCSECEEFPCNILEEMLDEAFAIKQMQDLLKE